MSEYCLLTAFVALVALSIIIYAAGGVQNLWTSASQTLGSGNTVTTGTGAGGAQPSGH